MWKDVMGGTDKENMHPSSLSPFISVCMYLFQMSTLSFACFLDMPKTIYRLKWLVALLVNSYECIEITVFEELHVEKISCWD